MLTMDKVFQLIAYYCYDLLICMVICVVVERTLHMSKLLAHKFCIVVDLIKFHTTVYGQGPQIYP